MSDKTAEQLRDCREAFNAWAEDNGFATYTAHQNGYEDAATQCAWEGWRGALQTNGSPVGWGDAKTVGQLISQLRTIDPSESIRTAYFVTIGGEKRTKVSGVTLSRERVEGGFIRTGDESVSYSNVIWASQDEREHTRADSGEAVAYCEIDNPINELAFAWPGTDRKTQHDTPLYLRPSDTELDPRDAARLDWLDAQVREGTRVELAKGLFGNSVEIGLRSPPRAFVKDTVREAIDAAIASREGK